jgi:hypothetical protein
MLLGALNERALAHSMGVSDALQRPVAMDEVMLCALPVGKSGLDLIGNGFGLVERARPGVSLLWVQALQAWCRRAPR